jgi:protein tyrosine/serine phosphatase
MTLVKGLLALLATFILAAASAFANPIGNFAPVSPGIYRGALPGLAGLRYLKSIGVKTIINLDGDRSDARDEAAWAKHLGLRMVAVPMSFFWRPKNRDVNKALAALRDPRLYPIYVHCHAGKDRTGLIVGLHRVEVQGMSPYRAYAEMLHYGFHDELFLLKGYYEDRTDIDL